MFVVPPGSLVEPKLQVGMVKLVYEKCSASENGRGRSKGLTERSALENLNRPDRISAALGNDLDS